MVESQFANPPTAMSSNAIIQAPPPPAANEAPPPTDAANPKACYRSGPPVSTCRDANRLVMKPGWLGNPTGCKFAAGKIIGLYGKFSASHVTDYRRVHMFVQTKNVFPLDSNLNIHGATAETYIKTLRFHPRNARPYGPMR